MKIQRVNELPKNIDESQESKYTWTSRRKMVELEVPESLTQNAAFAHPVIYLICNPCYDVLECAASCFLFSRYEISIVII